MNAFLFFFIQDGSDEVFAIMQSLLTIDQFSQRHCEATSILYCDPHSLVLDEVYEVSMHAHLMC